MLISIILPRTEEEESQSSMYRFPRNDQAGVFSQQSQQG